MAAPTPPQNNNSQYQFTDILQGLPFESIESVQDKKTGLKLAQRIYATQTAQSDNLNFFKARAAKWVYLEKWALGKQSTTEFLDYFNVSDGNKAYLNIDMSPIMLGAQFVGTLVDSMAKNEEYPCVTAIDDGSLSEKDQRKLDALLRMHEQSNIAAMQDAADMQLEPPDAYVPENELAAEIYFKLEDRLPKEIRMEEKLSAILTKQAYQRVLKPKLLFDLIVKNSGFTKVEKDGEGGARIRKCIGQNMLYNYFQGDTGDMEISYIGEIYSLKVRDLRKTYGLSPKNKDGLSEKDIFELAKSATQYNVGSSFIYPWIPEYQYYNYDRPWDDFSVPVFDFEIQVNIPEYSVSRVDSYGNEQIAPKKSKPVPTSEKSRVIKKDKTRWYRGVYAPFTNMMLYWGLPDIVLIPFLDATKALSSYTVNIPFNQGEYIPSLFERGMEPLKEYTLVKLKRKQLISKLRPTGIRVDIESARNIDLGNGDSIPWLEVLRIFDQTGNEIYSSRGLNPNEAASPALSATPQDDTVQKIIQLTATLQSIVSELRALWGVPNYRDGSDVGDRTAARLAEMQNTSSYNVTDFIENAENQLIEETLYKCLLFEWQKTIKEDGPDADEMINSTFQVDVKMKLTEYQKELLAQRIEYWSKTPDKYGNPLISPKDAFYIENIKDFKLAGWYMSNVIETNRRKHMEESEMLQQQNSKTQMEAAQQKGQQDQQLLQAKYDMDMQLKQAESNAKMKETVLSGIFEMLKAGAPIPAPYMPIVNAVMMNLAIPVIEENKEMQDQIRQKVIQEQQQAEQQEMQQQQITQAAAEQGISPEELMAQISQQQPQMSQPDPSQMN